MAAGQNILELAKQGDADAIASLINRSLQPKGITASAETIDTELDQELEITLLSAQLPSRTALISIIKKGMLALKIPAIALVRVYARHIENASLFWESEFALGDQTSQPAQPVISKESKSPARVEQQSPEPIVTESESRSPNLATRQGNQEAIVLLDTMAEMQRSNKAYQDVVIRFMDQRFDQVRCMTTLKEFIQVVSRSHFSFADMAGNPNLRNLVDTIADNSLVDRDGSHVISNVSILQPGQNWQNARIRLINRVIFEPVLEEPTETYDNYDEEYEREYEREYNRQYEDEVITLDVLDDGLEPGQPAASAKPAYTSTPESQVMPQSAAPDRFGMSAADAKINRVGRSLIDLDDFEQIDSAKTLDIAATVDPADGLDPADRSNASSNAPDTSTNQVESDSYHKDYPTADSLFDQFDNPSTSEQSDQNDLDSDNLDELEAMLGDLPPLEPNAAKSLGKDNEVIDRIDRGAETGKERLEDFGSEPNDLEDARDAKNLTLDEFAKDIWETV
jgi:hypothetical protein